MINLSKELPRYRLCTVCRSDQNVKDITFSYNDSYFSQGTQVALCKSCRVLLEETLRDEDVEEKSDGELQHR